MKPITVVIVFLALTLSSALASIGSYKNTESRIINDLNQALALTLVEKQDASITPDTLRVYREFLHIDALKSRAYLAYCPRKERSTITCSDTMVGHKNTHFIGIRGYANCSMATIFSLSDQRLPFSLSFLAMAWGCSCLIYFRRKAVEHLKDSQVKAALSAIHFTPMQEQLIDLFLHAEDHQLTKKEICNALWPKKDDASETLYTLIRRLKPVLSLQAGLHIVCERGKAYRLTKDRKE